MEFKSKILIYFALAVIAINGEPPRFRSSFRVRNSFPKFARQELPPPPAESNGAAGAPGTPESSPPYPPSGTKPDGPPFELPTETEPTQEYGPPPENNNATTPDTSYGPPSEQYGPPEETTPIAEESAPYPPAQAPYPPSGWKPSGRAFPLPTEKEAQPDNKYGPPTNEYGPPTNEYGPPTNKDTEDVGAPETDDDSIVVDTPKNGEPEAFFYVRLPNGTIQKVSFTPTKTSDQFRSAKLRQNSRNLISYVAQYPNF